MHVEFEKDRIIIVPDTAFEGDVLWQVIGDNIRCWHKHLEELSKAVKNTDTRYGEHDKEFIENMERNRFHLPKLDNGEHSDFKYCNPDFPDERTTIDPSFTGIPWTGTPPTTLTSAGDL